MGYITTISIYNDSVDQIEKNPKQFTEEVVKACSGVQINRGRDYAAVGNAANVLTLQKPRHADDTTLYMHSGNTLVDVWNAKSEWARNAFIAEMEYHLKRLKKERKR